jgi:hypothetical protein
MRRADLLALAATIAVALAMLGSSAFADDTPPQIDRVAAATGVLSLSNSRDGAAIFRADRMVPGQSVTGTITLGNTGEQGGRLLFSRARLDETPGLGGGRLADVLRLRIDDITDGTPQQMADGLLRDLPAIPLPDLPGGAERTYRFTVTFPDSGPGGADNVYAGASLQADYEWLTEAISAAVTPEPEAPRTTPGTVSPATPAEVAGVTDTAPRLTLRIPHQRVMHTDFVRVFAQCSERCTVRFSGRAETAARSGKPRTLKRRGVFRGERRMRTVRVRRERAIRLRIGATGRAVLRRTLDTRGRVGVVIAATVRGTRGTRTVRKRIVLHTTLIRDGQRIDFR